MGTNKIEGPKSDKTFLNITFLVLRKSTISMRTQESGLLICLYLDFNSCYQALKTRNKNMYFSF